MGKFDGSGIARIRKALRYSQTSLGEQLGVSQHAVGAWEAGRHAPTPTRAYMLLDLAKRYRVEASLEDIYPRPKKVPVPPDCKADLAA